MSAPPASAKDGKAEEHKAAEQDKADCSREAVRSCKCGRLELLFRDVYFPFLMRFRYPILVLYGALVIIYIVFAAQLEPDPETPRLWPGDDNYNVYGEKLAELFAREDNPRRIYAQLVVGITEIDQDTCDGDDCDPTLAEDLGTVIWSEDTLDDMARPLGQKWVLDLCEAAEKGTVDGEVTGGPSVAERLVYAADDILPNPVICWAIAFQKWCLENNCPRTDHLSDTRFLYEMEDYITDEDNFLAAVIEWLADDMSPDDIGYEAGFKYADFWEDYIHAEDVFGTTIFRFFNVEVALTETVEYDFEDGITLFEQWEDFAEGWRVRGRSQAYGSLRNMPATLFACDDTAFAYFFLQRRIIQEAVTGILLSLFLAFVVIAISAGNWLLSLYATLCIGTMVMGVLSFFIFNGWKLGVLEAVIAVMVVGVSVDYVVHLSDAYVENTEPKREDRVREMLYRMGVSVLSGAFSTIGAAFFLLFPRIVFLQKFGATLFFLVGQSLVFSLLFYSTAMTLVGPEAPSFDDGPFKKHTPVVGRIRRGSKNYDHAADLMGSSEATDPAFGSVVMVTGSIFRGEPHYDKAGAEYYDVMVLMPMPVGAPEQRVLEIPTSDLKRRYEQGSLSWVRPMCLFLLNFYKRMASAASGVVRNADSPNKLIEKQIEDQAQVVDEIHEKVTEIDETVGLLAGQRTRPSGSIYEEAKRS